LNAKQKILKEEELEKLKPFFVKKESKRQRQNPTG